MDFPLVLGLACLLAYWMGYSVNQAGTCAVATAFELLHHRRPRRFVGLAAASAAAAVVALPLTWSGLGDVSLASVTGVTSGVIIGAVLFGVGATINDACLLGSLGRLGEGEVRLAALPIGLAAGFFAADLLLLGHPPLEPSPLSSPTRLGMGALTAFVLLVVISIAFVRRGTSLDREQRRWPLGAAMIVLGMTGGTLYVTAPAWTYADLLQRSLPLTMALSDGAGVPTVAASLAGAITAARRRRTWRVRFPDAKATRRTLAGGFLMGVGAAMIPGGNDGLVLAAIPALSPGGIAAYLIMTLVIVACLAAKPHLKRMLR